MINSYEMVDSIIATFNFIFSTKKHIILEDDWYIKTSYDNTYLDILHT